MNHVSTERRDGGREALLRVRCQARPLRAAAQGHALAQEQDDARAVQPHARKAQKVKGLLFLNYRLRTWDKGLAIKDARKCSGFTTHPPQEAWNEKVLALCSEDF